MEGNNVHIEEKRIRKHKLLQDVKLSTLVGAACIIGAVLTLIILCVGFNNINKTKIVNISLLDNEIQKKKLELPQDNLNNCLARLSNINKTMGSIEVKDILMKDTDDLFELDEVNLTIKVKDSKNMSELLDKVSKAFTNGKISRVTYSNSGKLAKVYIEVVVRNENNFENYWRDKYDKTD